MSLDIRYATIDDVALILRFIKELAAVEGLSHKVTATEEILAMQLFGEKKYAETILVYWESKPVGFALFFHYFLTYLGKPSIFLENLYVIPEMRGRGIAKNIFSYLAEITLERGAESLDWCVLDSNVSARAFYEKIGATEESEWVMYSISGNKLKNLINKNYDFS